MAGLPRRIGPGFESNISHNDRVALQDHYAILNFFIIIEALTDFNSLTVFVIFDSKTTKIWNYFIVLWHVTLFILKKL